ncbi:MAG: bifunctional homocysteine S-methyltransferase/methylenetetrahydrofolate reductase [Myxococcales bacterium]|nr:MAG: bifunctional homocysteine S-methyltransferase/methylenetetrahydrofolate reductase [Myxococcales bacterium]
MQSVRKSLMEALEQGALVFDGAMGTVFYERGVLYTVSFDELCVSRPELVRKVHAEYLEAGAQVLQTNTFGANRYRLATHSLTDKVAAINEAAVKLAREVAQDRAYVVGSVGPTGLAFKTVDPSEHASIQEAFSEQCQALCKAGVDALILETFRHPEEAALALAAAKSAAGSATPVIAQVSFDAFGTMADGTGPEEMAKRLIKWGANAIGVNCADGPAGVYEMATRMLGLGVPVVAQPNAGLPRRVEGRFAYMATPEYFLLYARRLFKAGVSAVGGCCGTTPEHIQKIIAAARMVGGSDHPELGGGMRDFSDVQESAAPGVRVLSLEEKGELGKKLNKKFVVSVEVNPPPGLSLQKALDGVKILKEGGIDVINVAENARATMRMGNLALCLRIQEQFGMPTLMHLTTRDRNLLGLVSHLLAVHELGVRNLVVITGDPPKMGDLPDATSVYDLDSIGLLRLIRGFNHGFDPGGKPLGGATSFLCATGAEPGAADYARETRRLRSKAEAGAELIMTQPVYDPEYLERFLKDVEPLGVPVLVGLLPLASYRNAEFLHNEVPGMQVPLVIRERMRKAGSGPEGRKEGIAIAREMLAAVKDRVAGAYIMPPFSRYESALEVIDGLVD